MKNDHLMGSEVDHLKAALRWVRYSLDQQEANNNNNNNDAVNGHNSEKL